MCLAGLLFAGLSGQLSAQPFEQEFKYGGKRNYEATIKFDVTYTRGDNPEMFPLKPKDKGVIDLQGAGNGTLVISFNPKSLDWHWGSHDKEYTLYIRPGCISPPAELKNVRSDDIAVTTSVPDAVRLEYRIQENGSGQLKIGGFATNSKDSLGCTPYFRFDFTVSGLVDKAKRDCEEALAAFAANKTGGIGLVKKVKFEHPDAPCLSEVNNIIAEYDLWHKANTAPNCEDAKKHCKAYLDKYGNEGLFSVEINTINNNCKTTPKPEAKSENKASTTVKEKSEEEKAFARIQKSTNKDSLQGFIDFWSDKSPGSDFVRQAKALLARLLPIEYEEKILPDGRHQFRLLNVNKPRIKNLSLLGDMDINTDRLLTDNIFTVSIGTGEYSVFVKDASGKQTTIKITNEFGATVTPVAGMEAWLLRVNGGKKPYVVHLVDIANPNDVKTWKGSLNSDTLLLTLEELQDRGLDKSYRVLVKNNERSSRPAEAGVVEGRSTDGGSTVLDAILYVLLLFIVLSAVYGVYLLVWYRKAKQRKATIYDSFQ